jgi:hypothetical protein
LPSVDPRAAEIIATVTEFEASVGAAEAALVARDWPRIDALLSTQHRLTHALANALEETRDARPEAFTNEVNRRIAGILARRDDQLRRLIAFNHLVKERLTMISRTREIRRVHVDSRPAARILDILQ